MRPEHAASKVVLMRSHAKLEAHPDMYTYTVQGVMAGYEYEKEVLWVKQFNFILKSELVVNIILLILPLFMITA